MKSGVVFVFRHHPLPIHANAGSSAQASECARQQGQFEQMRDALFENQSSLGEPLYLRLAKSLGLDVDTFEQCTRTENPQLAIDLTLARSLRLTGTPTFLIGQLKDNDNVKVGKVLRGLSSIQQFEEAIDPMLIATSK